MIFILTHGNTFYLSRFYNIYFSDLVWLPIWFQFSDVEVIGHKFVAWKSILIRFVPSLMIWFDFRVSVLNLKLKFSNILVIGFEC